MRASPQMPGFEETVRPAVWDMAKGTYAKIGLILDHPSDLDEYNVWDIYDVDGGLRAFRLGKTTPYGVKGGLVGSDGSKEGRTAVKEYAAEWYFQPGQYGEVSHRMETLVLDAGAPVVCAVYAARVLNKPIEYADDGVHYRRTLKNVGDVTKILVGRPYGVPVTSIAAPRCPIPPRELAGRQRMPVDRSDESLFEHAASRVVL